MIIGKKFEFHACHKLAHPERSKEVNEETYGACYGMHGHTWKFLVEIEGSVNEFGWIMNFSELKKLVNKKVLSKLDHHDGDIGEVIGMIPTAENLAKWIWNQLEKDIEWTGQKLRKVKIYETDTSYAKYYGNEK